MMALAFFASLVIFGITNAAVPGDLITELPGLAVQPSFKQYSGYLKASGTKKLHYWFVESQRNPKFDPLILWMNGGPGCSSVLGLLTEHGPFRIMDDGKTVYYNNASWNLVSNMIYLEAPAGVGFSYSDDRNYTITDDQVAHDNYLALKDFFSKYPEYSSHDFYVTGESYGGVYVPTLSALVVDDKDINFQGMVIGNGLSNYDLNDNSLIYFGYYHGLYGADIWHGLIKSCCNGNYSGQCMFTKGTGDDCRRYVTEVSQIVYNSGLNEYNLYGECAGGAQQSQLTFDEESQKVISHNFGWLFSNVEHIKKEFAMNKILSKLNKLQLDPPCINATNVADYLNTDKTRQILHIPSVVQKWSTCSDDVSAHYISTYQDMSAEYRKVLAAKKRVMVYNGDVDMACNFLGDEWFVERLNLDVVAERMEWFYNAADDTKQVAGFIKQFQNLDLVTVRGAGHMVPTDKPLVALQMLNNYLNIKGFQK